VVSTKEQGGAPLLLNDGVPANFAEAFRVVRTNVLFSSAEAGMRSLVVTSTGPSEGKTIVASNLAMALAQSGQRVLLVDADLRRPAIHERFGVKAEPGLSNLMVGNAKATDAVRKTAVAAYGFCLPGACPPIPLSCSAHSDSRTFLAA